MKNSSSTIVEATDDQVGMLERERESLVQNYNSSSDQISDLRLMDETMLRLQNELIQMKKQLNVTERKTDEHEKEIQGLKKDNLELKDRIKELESCLYNAANTTYTTLSTGKSVTKATHMTSATKEFSSPPLPSTSFRNLIHSSGPSQNLRQTIIQNNENTETNRTSFNIDLESSIRTIRLSSDPSLRPNNFKRVQSEMTAQSQIKEAQLSHDIYSLMMIKRTFSKSWFFAILIITIQVTLLVLIFHNQIESSTQSTVFDVPFKVTTGVRVAQYLAIFISIMISYDILMPIKDLSMLWITNKSEWSKVVIGVHRLDYNSLRISWKPAIKESFDYNDDDDDEDANADNNHKWTTKCCPSLIPPSHSDEKGTSLSINRRIWILHILLPNIIKFIQGVLVLFITFVIVIQSDNIIDLFKDFAAMQVLSELDNVAYNLADHGYFGSRLKEDTVKVKDVKLTDDVPKIAGRLPLRLVVLVSLLGLMMSIFVGIVVEGQESGSFFHEKYPMCRVMDLEDIGKISDGECNGGLQNTFQCGFDGGDCYEFNIAFPYCKSKYAFEIGDGVCQMEHNTVECGFDGGDCCMEQLSDLVLYGDGQCHPGMYNGVFCGYDNGDCEMYRRKYPLCQADIINDSGLVYGSNDTSIPKGILGDGVCNFISEYLTEECGFEYGDCANCQVDDYSLLGNGFCDGGLYNTEACGWDNGDCV